MIMAFNGAARTGANDGLVQSTTNCATTPKAISSQQAWRNPKRSEARQPASLSLGQWSTQEHRAVSHTSVCFLAAPSSPKPRALLAGLRARLHFSDLVTPALLAAVIVSASPSPRGIAYAGQGTVSYGASAGAVNNGDAPAVGAIAASSSESFGATASGDFSIALGAATGASGYKAVAIGSGSFATKQFSTAVGAGNPFSGDNTQAVGDSASAFGYNAHADGSNSTAIGSGSRATGANSSALGFQAKASGDQASA